MQRMSRAGIVDIEYSHFSVGEIPGDGFDLVDAEVDFQTDRPVIVVPGLVVVISRVQAHYAPVVLALSHGQDAVPGEGWQLVDTVSYTPVYAGLMAVYDTMNGISSPSDAPLVLFGQSAEPGEPVVELDPGWTYRVQVWAQGRDTSRERHEAAMAREEWGASEGFEAYAVVFFPASEQEAPEPAHERGLRARFARQRAEEEAIRRAVKAKEGDGAPPV
ncbi:hypothetical protein [Streptomyces sp. NPDC057302]|uniref:hypothetical protein n=1 Tax=Streptomyces sp. NPDC057302 TaxID=3346094 RepID=UPI003641FB6B